MRYLIYRQIFERRINHNYYSKKLNLVRVLVHIRVKHLGEMHNRNIRVLMLVLTWNFKDIVEITHYFQKI